jgi:hypothetical protein
MEKYRSASDLLRVNRPERPVLTFRPHAATRATRWFLRNFPGKCLYAVKANDAPHMLETLHAAGIRDFDVASIAEIERLSHLEGSLAAARGLSEPSISATPREIAGRMRAHHRPDADWALDVARAVFDHASPTAQQEEELVAASPARDQSNRLRR